MLFEPFFMNCIIEKGFLSNLAYVVIYLVNREKLLEKANFQFSSSWKKAQKAIFWSEIHFFRKRIPNLLGHPVKQFFNCASFLLLLSFNSKNYWILNSVYSRLFFWSTEGANKIGLDFVSFLFSLCSQMLASFQLCPRKGQATSLHTRQKCP